jgi:hypothetical protein
VWSAPGVGPDVPSHAVLAPTQYHTFAPPAQVGATSADPVFGTRITRLTVLDPARRTSAEVTNSEISYFNADGTLFLGTDETSWGAIFDGRTGEKLKRFDRGTMQPWAIRWSPDPNRFYKYEGNEVRLYDVRDLSYKLLHRFQEYDAIGPAGGEGDVSDDGRYWCLDGGARLFVYDLIDDKRGPESPFIFDGNNIDYAAVSCSGRYVIVLWRKTGAERHCGTELYDREWNFIRQLVPWCTHVEVAYGPDGEEILVVNAQFRQDEFNARWKVQPGDIISVRFSDGHVTRLLQIPRWAHSMFSACNSVTTPQYIYAALDARFDPEKEWYPYHGEIIEVPTDGSQQVRRLVHHRSRPVQGVSQKGTQPDFCINRQGTKIIFKSNFGGPRTDLYMFDVSQADKRAPQPRP